jgi:omega-amidase
MPSDNTTIALVQMRVRHSDPDANLSRAGDLVAEAARRGAQLVCLPEMWTTGFDWDWIAANAALQKPAIARAAGIARENAVWLNGSMLDVNAEGRPVNRSILFSPEGTIAAGYCKAHLFGMFREQHHLAAGSELGWADTPFARVGLTVCYDLRFPELFRAYAVRGVNLQLLPAAFPQPRREHWRILIRARAIENQCFFAATNQVGTEEFGPDDTATYFGTSMLVDPWGSVLLEGEEAREEVLTAEVDMEEAARVRAKMTVLQDRRPELYGA